MVRRRDYRCVTHKHHVVSALILTPTAGWPLSHHPPTVPSPRVHWATRAVHTKSDLEVGMIWLIILRSCPIPWPLLDLTYSRKLILNKDQRGAPIQAPNLNPFRIHLWILLGMSIFKMRSYILSWKTWINQIIPDSNSRNYAKIWTIDKCTMKITLGFIGKTLWMSA